MRKYIFIGVGGFLGAVIRYYIRGIQNSANSGGIPINTLLINAVGAFVLAVVLTIALEKWHFNTDLRLGVSVGLLGALTTFSTLCKETVGLIMAGDISSALMYVAFSILLGYGAAFCGIAFARVINRQKRGATVKERADERIGTEGETE